MMKSEHAGKFHTQYLLLIVVMVVLNYVLPLVRFTSLQTILRFAASVLLLLLIGLSLYVIKTARAANYPGAMKVVAWVLFTESVLAFIAAVIISSAFNELTARAIGGEVIAVVGQMTNTFLLIVAGMLLITARASKSQIISKRWMGFLVVFSILSGAIYVGYQTLNIAESFEYMGDLIFAIVMLLYCAVPVIYFSHQK